MQMEPLRNTVIIETCQFIRPACYQWCVLCVMWQLVKGGDANAIELTDLYDWYFVAVVNPDGYEYTWTTVSIVDCILFTAFRVDQMNSLFKQCDKQYVTCVDWRKVRHCARRRSWACQFYMRALCFYVNKVTVKVIMAKNYQRRLQKLCSILIKLTDYQQRSTPIRYWLEHVNNRITNLFDLFYPKIMCSTPSCETRKSANCSMDW